MIPSEILEVADLSANGQSLPRESFPAQPPYNDRRLIEEVWIAEQQYLSKRREAAGKEASGETVGLALSGGGIRSASFNLGVVQALMARGKFKDVDYLSTVSGGGYLGGFLGAQMANLRQKDADPSCEEPDRSYQDFILPKTTGEQTNAVKRLLRSGRYLKRVPHFINRYLFGLAVVNLWLFLGLAALGAGLAGLFRLLDLRGMIRLAKALGFGGDISRAFLPACLVALVWVGVWMVRYAKQIHSQTEHTPRLDAATRILAILMLILAALGLVAVLATQDVALPAWSPSQDATPEVNSAIHTLAIVVVALQVIALVPLLRLDRLIQSGSQPRGLRDSVVFNLVGPAVVFGIPLMAFGWFARENVSSVIEAAPTSALTVVAPEDDAVVDQGDSRLLCFTHIRDWEGFWTMIQERAAAGRPLEKSLLKAANARPVKDRRPPGDDVQASIEIERSYRQTLEKLPPLLGSYRILTTLELCRERDVTQRQIVNRINRMCLTDPDLFKAVAASDPPQSLDKRAFPDWLLRAQSLSKLTPAQQTRGEVASVNRQALQAYFGNAWLHPPGTVFALTAIGPDQWHRLWRCLVFTCLWVFSGLALSPNLGSLQEFYRERLQFMWLPRRKVKGPDRSRVVLSALAQPDKGGHEFPYLLINATAHVFRSDASTFFGSEPDKRPRQTRFEFAPAFCGYAYEAHGETTHRRLYQKTDAYEKQLYLDLPGVMAISGSAVSPAMSDNFVLKALLFLSNLRLGQWVQQPGAVKDRPKRPKMLPCLSQVLLPLSASPEFLFLSDGGHYDNLGLEALLDRRVRRIICVDVGHDPKGRFVDLLKVVRRSRFLNGVRIKTTLAGELGFAELERVKGSVAGAHFFEAKIVYPDQSEGTLYYVKPSFDLDEPAELINYRDENPDFPHDPTLDQFYDERRFESYRALGWHIGEKVAAALSGAPDSFASGRDDQAAQSGLAVRVASRDGVEVSLINRLIGLDGSDEVVQELLMGLKEELALRRAKSVPITDDEQLVISRFLLNYGALERREPWEEAILFACITDLLTENPDLERATASGVLQNEQLRRCASRLARSLQKLK